VSDALRGLQAVSAAAWDAIVVNQASARLAIEQSGLTQLKIRGESGYRDRLVVAVSRQDPLLYRILDKTVDRIPTQRRREWCPTWVSGGGDDLVDSLLAGVEIAVAGAAGLLWLWSVVLRVTVRRQTRQIQSDLDRIKATEAK
jgi:hypothetical protein